MEEARYLEVAKKVRGTHERDWRITCFALASVLAYTTCSTSITLQFHNLQFHNTTTGNAARARQHLETPPTHAPRQAAEKRASNKTHGLRTGKACYSG